MTAYFTELNGDMMAPRTSFGVCDTTDILSIRMADCYPFRAEFSLLMHSDGKNMLSELEYLYKYQAVA